MSDYISREAALGIIKRTSGDYAAAFSEVVRLPAADVRPVVRGEWIPITERLRSWKHGFEDVTTGYKCSVCGREERFMEPFCNCGADMRPEGGSNE